MDESSDARTRFLTVVVVEDRQQIHIVGSEERVAIRVGASGDSWERHWACG